jgi:hypothetical protein
MIFHAIRSAHETYNVLYIIYSLRFTQQVNNRSHYQSTRSLFIDSVAFGIIRNGPRHQILTNVIISGPLPRSMNHFLSDSVRLYTPECFPCMVMGALARVQAPPSRGACAPRPRNAPVSYLIEGIPQLLGPPIVFLQVRNILYKVRHRCVPGSRRASAPGRWCLYTR